MPDSAEGGTAIAWRLLATLEGGSLLLATSALLAYSASGRIARKTRRPLNNVLVTNTTSELGKEIKRRLEYRGCTVSTVTSDARSIATSTADKVDALVVVGAKPQAVGLDGISDLVTEDVYDNLKFLESLSPRVSCGGSIAWACESAEVGAVAGVGAFSGTAAAFDAVLHASLQHVAKVYNCEPIWVGRYNGAEETAERIIAALISPSTLPNTTGFSIRNSALKLGEYLYRWLKTFT